MSIRKSLGDWAAFIGKVELALALEEKFGVSISDEELETSDTIESLASAIHRKSRVTGVTEADIAKEAVALLSVSLNTSPVTVLPASSLRELFSQHERADA